MDTQIISTVRLAHLTLDFVFGSTRSLNRHVVTSVKYIIVIIMIIIPRGSRAHRLYSGGAAERLLPQSPISSRASLPTGSHGRRAGRRAGGAGLSLAVKRNVSGWIAWTAQLGTLPLAIPGSDRIGLHWHLRLPANPAAQILND